ncbi:transmembrane protein, putative [Medicago truncatula]|uniref:Transmembrane protein, putative n=1 Tax=Medicago truncatula TaxID=3880 RepID=A0A072U8F3_MEDTR|nr:transmembrane protein, putative [Medicago truncatula]
MIAGQPLLGGFLSFVCLVNFLLASIIVFLSYKIFLSLESILPSSLSSFGTSIEVFVIAFFRIMCKCVSCDSRKRRPSEWERHTLSRVKKWK